MTNCCMCSSDIRRGKISIFRLPKDERMRQCWSKACKKPLKKTAKVCEKHFLKKDFISLPGSSRARLLPCAIPSVFFEEESPMRTKEFREILKSVRANSKENNNINTFAETNITEEFDSPPVDPIGEEQNLTIVVSDDEEEIEKNTTNDEVEISLENCRIDQTEKCGHIFYNVYEDDFSLKCLFCSTVYFDLLTFSKHVKMQHENLCNKKLQTTLDADIGNVKNSFIQNNNIIIETTDEVQGSIVTIYSRTESNELPEHNTFDSNFHIELNDAIEEDDANEVDDAVEQIDAIEDVDGILNSSSLSGSDDENDAIKSEDQMENLGIDLNNRALISCFIHLIKRKPIVYWNIERNLKKRKTAFECISHALSKKFPHISFTYENLIGLINTMRAAFRSELRQEKDTKDRGIDYVPQLWFFNKLKSLDYIYSVAAIQNNIKCLQEVAMQFPLNIYSTSSNDNVTTTLEIIQYYEKQPHLWNIDHPNFSDKLCGIEQFYELLKAKYSNDIAIPFNEFEAALKQMHRWFATEENIRLNVEKLNQTYTSCYPQIYKALEFLRGHVPPFRCDICAKTFQIYRNFSLHRKNCSVLECKYCHNRYTAAGLKAHIKMHTNERSNLCTFCGNKYKTKTGLRKHINRSHKAKMFKCHECKRIYHSHNALRIHIKSHLGIKDYICDLCGKGFTSSKYLNTHRSIHFPEKKRYMCNKCGKTFLAPFSQAHKENCVASRLERKISKENQFANKKVKTTVQKIPRRRKNKIQVRIEGIFNYNK